MNTQDRVVDLNNRFRLEEVGLIRGENWYTLRAYGDVLDWILDYDPTQWVNQHNTSVCISEGMLTMLRLKYSDREIRNPYLGLIPTGNLFYGNSAEAEVYREHTFAIQRAQAKMRGT